MNRTTRLLTLFSSLLFVAGCCGEDKFKLRGQEPEEVQQEEIPEWLKKAEKPPMKAPPPGSDSMYGIKGPDDSPAMAKEKPLNTGVLAALKKEMDEEDGMGAVEGPGSYEGLGTGGVAPGSEGDDKASGSDVDPGKAMVKGSLSKEIIQRVVRKHVKEVQYCYEKELAKKPDLAGRVSVQFVISPTGNVQTAKVASSTMNDSTVEECVVKAVKKWAFPAPEGGGVVIVTYPFSFKSAK